MESIAWGHGVAIEGTPFRTVVAAGDTRGQLVALAADMPPGLHVDAHVHPDEEQIDIVIEGTVTCRVGTEWFRVGPGGTVCVPCGVEHELRNDTDQVARLVNLYTPPGMELVFAAGGRATLADASPADAARS